jgi:hypothetical protein
LIQQIAALSQINRSADHRITRFVDSSVRLWLSVLPSHLGDGRVVFISGNIFGFPMSRGVGGLGDKPSPVIHPT